MAKIGGDDAGFFVNTEALRTDAGYWDEMSGELEAASECPVDLIHFGKITNMNPLVDAANDAIAAIRARCQSGSSKFWETAEELRGHAQEYEDTEREIF